MIDSETGSTARRSTASPCPPPACPRPVLHQSITHSLNAVARMQVIWHDSLLPAESPSLKGTQQLRLLRTHLLSSFPDLVYKVTGEEAGQGLEVIA